jgi:hypothetical protein
LTVGSTCQIITFVTAGKKPYIKISGAGSVKSMFGLLGCQKSFGGLVSGFVKSLVGGLGCQKPFGAILR